MKKKLTAGLALALCAAVGMTAAGCGGGNRRGKVTITVWAAVSADNNAEMEQLVKTFNDGNTRYYVDLKKQAPGFSGSLSGNLKGSNVPNVVQIEDDRNYKGYINDKLLTNLDEYFTDKLGDKGEVVRAKSALDLSDMWDSAVARYRYNPTTGYSGGNEPLYGLPAGISPSVMFYNEDALKSQGVNIISVAEDNLEGTGYLPHGFYKYDNAPAAGLNQKNGKYYVFNNQIPMNWDELLEISKMFTRSYAEGANSPTEYGFFNEWWFSFGWSVGGDCLEWDDAKNQYVFALGEETKNYLVTGENGVQINGTGYAAGDILSYADKHYVENVLSAGSGSDYSTINGYVEAQKLYELPSIRDAFTLFISLSQTKDKEVTSGTNGLALSPTPNIIKNKSKRQLLTSGEVAFVVENYSEARALGREMDKIHKNWNVAPLYQYREYEADGSVKKVNGTEIKGKVSGHSNTTCWAIPENAKAKDGAFEFIEFMAGSEAQSVLMKTNLSLPNQKSVAYSDAYLNMTDNYICGNKAALLTMAENGSVGDWSYLENGSWVTVWSQTLNTKVRNGEMTLDQFFADPCIEKTNTKLKEFHAKKFNG